MDKVKPSGPTKRNGPRKDAKFFVMTTKDMAKGSHGSKNKFGKSK